MSLIESVNGLPASSASGDLETLARHNMEICNACRYCEGYCAVFPAMERRRAFETADLNYLANLCHNCQGCYHACQYAPPHEFGVNVPQVFADLRLETYHRYAWPGFLAGLFHRGGLVAVLAIAGGLALVLGLSMVLVSSDVLLGVHRGPGAFYAVIPYDVMVAVPSVISVFVVIALIVGFVRFWNETATANAPAMTPGAIVGAVSDVLTLRHLGGGGHGCNDLDDTFSQARLIHHQLVMYGFLLCFAATSVATVYDHFLDWPAPYPFLSAPVILGTVGGIGLMIGTVGLFVIKRLSDPAPKALHTLGLDYGFLALLFGTALTGLLLLVLRETAAMGVLLAVHLGFVLALFLLLPYSKFVHGVYRFVALLRNAAEERSNG